MVGTRLSCWSSYPVELWPPLGLALRSAGLKGCSRASFISPLREWKREWILRLDTHIHKTKFYRKRGKTELTSFSTSCPLSWPLLHISHSLNIHLCTFLPKPSLAITLSLHVAIHPSIHQCMHLFVPLPIHPSLWIYINACVRSCLFPFPPINPYPCLSHTFIHPSL